MLLSAGQLLFDRCGAAADPYMTLVGYFNATRELAGMARYMADDVQNRVKRPAQGLRLPVAGYGAAFGLLNIGELTSRIASAEIGRTLDRLGLEFDPDYDTTEAFQRAAWPTRRAGKKVAVPQRGTVRRRAGDLDAAGRCRRAAARADAGRRSAEEHRRVHPGVLARRS